MIDIHDSSLKRNNYLRYAFKLSYKNSHIVENHNK